MVSKVMRGFGVSLMPSGLRCCNRNQFYGVLDNLALAIVRGIE